MGLSLVASLYGPKIQIWQQLAMRKETVLVKWQSPQISCYHAKIKNTHNITYADINYQPRASFCSVIIFYTF